MGRTKTKPFLKRKSVPKFYFHFGHKKSVLPSSFNTFLVMWKYNCEPLWRKRWKRHNKQLLLLMRCKIIKLPVLNIRAKHAKIAIHFYKEQRFSAALNFNEFDVLTTNICLGSLEVYATYWKHIYSIQNSVCILTPVEIKITNHVIKKEL
jgi:hypothetical protein